MKIQITEDQFQNAKTFAEDYGLVGSINSLRDYMPRRKNSRPVFQNTDERWGDAYFFRWSEVAGMRKEFGWTGEPENPAEVPESVFVLLKIIGVKTLDAWLKCTDSLSELEEKLEEKLAEK